MEFNKKILSLLLLATPAIFANETGEEQKPARGWFGRVDKSDAICEVHYQTSSFSATRLWLALKLPGYTVTKESLNKALKIAAYNNDAKKINILTGHGADPKQGLSPAAYGGAEKAVAVLLQKGAGIDAEVMKGLEGCFASCFQGGQGPEASMKKLASCQNVAKQFKKANAEVVEKYAKIQNSLQNTLDLVNATLEEKKGQEAILTSVTEGFDKNIENFFNTFENQEKAYQEELKLKKEEQKRIAELTKQELELKKREQELEQQARENKQTAWYFSTFNPFN